MQDLLIHTTKHMYTHTAAMYACAHIHAYAHSCSHIDTAAITQAGTHLYIHGSRLKKNASFDTQLWSSSPLKMTVCFLSHWTWLCNDILAHAKLASTELGRWVGLSSVWFTSMKTWVKIPRILIRCWAWWLVLRIPNPSDREMGGRSKQILRASHPSSLTYWEKF